MFQYKPLVGGPVIRISLPWLIEALSAIDSLDRIQEGQALSDVRYTLFNAQRQLDNIYMTSIYGSALRSSRDHAQKVRNTIEPILEKGDDYEFTDLQIWTLNNAKEQFKTVFMAEISVFPSFFVTQKGTHDTLLLIEEGAKLFPPRLLSKAPETKFDADEVGKALAYELGTACGFHAFRVTEAVVKRYWDFVSKGKKRPKLETLGNYAAEMEKKGFGDTKVIESMKQMTKLHRNPIAHPEYILSVEEALGIVGMAHSLIGAMLNVLPDVPTTTGTP